MVIKAILLQNGGNGALGVSAVRAVMEVLDIVGESVSQVCTALVVQRRRSLATSTSLVVRKSSSTYVALNINSSLKPAGARPTRLLLDVAVCTSVYDMHDITSATSTQYNSVMPENNRHSIALLYL